MAKLTKTQINAVAEKLTRDWNKKLDAQKAKGLTQDQMNKANERHIRKLIKDSNLNKTLVAILCKATNWGSMAENILEEVENDDGITPKMVAALKLPHAVETQSEFDRICELKDKFGAMIEDLKFELTMEGDDTYKKLMADFSKRTASLLK